MIAIYARQSVEKHDSISLESQIEFAKREALSDDIKIYQDSGFSGKNTNRPAFHEMMTDIKNGSIEKVIVYRLDRISRSILDFADFINELEERQIPFVSATEKFDTSTPVGRAMLYIVVVFAQLERETIGERVRDNYYARVKKGAWGGGPPAFGFDLQRTVIDGKACTGCVPNEKLEIVKKIYELYARPSASLGSVQKELLQMGVQSERGANFTSVKLSSILKNPAYVRADLAIYNYYKSRGCIMGNDKKDFDGIHGCNLVGKRDAKDRKYKDVKDHLLSIGNHEGIVDSTTFLYVQDKLSKNVQIKNTGKGKHSWLTGLVKCGKCGYAMTINSWQTKKGVKRVFACTGHRMYQTCDIVFSHDVNEVENAVAHRMIEEAEAYRLAKKQKENTAAHEYQQKVSEIDSKIDNLVLSLENISDVSATYINRRIEALHQEKLLLLAKYNTIIADAQAIDIIPFSADDWYSMSMEDKREIAHSMIEKVLVFPDHVEVILK